MPETVRNMAIAMAMAAAADKSTGSTDYKQDLAGRIEATKL
jgi:hypothetical protein